MTNGLRILWEEIDSANVETEFLTEGGTGRKSWFIKGPFAVGEAKNKNGRSYPAPILEREINRFIDEKVGKGMAGGELNHPQSPEVNPERISHYIQELKRDGNIWQGKAKVSRAPMGKIVESLLEDGYKLGVSTRGLGTVAAKGMVNEDYKLITVDIVGNPSGPGCYVDPIMENREYVIMEDGRIAEKSAAAYATLEHKLVSLPKHDIEKYLNEAISAFLRGLK